MRALVVAIALTLPGCVRYGGYNLDCAEFVGVQYGLWCDSKLPDEIL